MGHPDGSFSGRSAVFGDPMPVDPGCCAALPEVLAARKITGIQWELRMA
jgi:hypothetical protein